MMPITSTSKTDYHRPTIGTSNQNGQQARKPKVVTLAEPTGRDYSALAETTNEFVNDKLQSKADKQLVSDAPDELIGTEHEEKQHLRCVVAKLYRYLGGERKT